MFRFVRRRRSARVVATVVGVGVGIGVLGCAALVAMAPHNGDPDPQDSDIAICSDVPVHAGYTEDLGSKAQPDKRKREESIPATSHSTNPFPKEGQRCPIIGGVFGSRVYFKAPGLNDGQPVPVTAPTDRKHVLIVRFTKNANNTVTVTHQSMRWQG
ncbi:hypothetical protein [Actinacidiphila oryziradicis]|uniref:Uncharacterized protein n=1 Tax=Actinacidiphila oryziradicis TaxID=2571141 RepID=A0A4U0RUI3_9ACTN|nr:hypothetical protein [Actinacidiphila oryziradicis]TJZ99126.1 hypothetical protein FCI23_47115 [Actinacidiphila oryziradicis]